MFTRYGALKFNKKSDPGKLMKIQRCTATVIESSITAVLLQRGSGMLSLSQSAD